MRFCTLRRNRRQNSFFPSDAFSSCGSSTCDASPRPCSYIYERDYPCGFHLITFGGGASGSVFTSSTSPLAALLFFPLAAYMIPATAASRMTPSGTPMPMEAEVVSVGMAVELRSPRSLCCACRAHDLVVTRIEVRTTR
ncbi:hypothetical protein BU23DRAFT_276015 [Bimuria novae-zelandiae CBS 107.79]|uniref:Uncharacterized protein n=1 Tax=Bimuria novae-zelandiae CBS 107.79 TaxID=1447943 RepID=A0A6A5VN56_9PLEO|nr:hypothetical protein BU23DRAFT_276015 [Bimuria novae-zelandiae CBS 107.79]